MPHKSLRVLEIESEHMTTCWTLSYLQLLGVTMLSLHTVEVKSCYSSEIYLCKFRVINEDD